MNPKRSIDSVAPPSGFQPKRVKMGAPLHSPVITLYEKWDMNALGQLINAATRDNCYFDAGSLAKVKRVFGALNADGELKVEYYYSEWVSAAGHSFGRTNGNGYQSIPGSVRRICGHKFYFDLDIVNAHFVFLEQLCKRNGIACPQLSYYVANRDHCLKQLGSDRDTAKKSYLCILFGAATSDESPGPLKSLHVERAVIVDKLWLLPKYQPIREACILHVTVFNGTAADEDKKDEKNTFLSFVLQDIEFKITRDNIAYLHQQNVKVGANCHDGMLVEKSTIVDLDVILKGLEANTLAQHGFKVRYVQKSMDPKIDDLSHLWHPFNDPTQSNKFSWQRVIAQIDSLTAMLNKDDSLCLAQRESRLSRRVCELFNMVFACVSGVKPTVHERELRSEDGVVTVAYKERSVDDFRKMIGNDKLLVLMDRGEKDNKDKYKEVSPVTLWLSDRRRLKYARVVFNAKPRGNQGAASPDELNLFQGLKVVPTGKYSDDDMTAEVWKDDIGSFLGHVLHGLCRSDADLFYYVIRWLAVTVLRPWEKLRQCVVMQAEEGSGKGTLVEIIKQCIGDQYVTAPPTLEEALDGFNACYVDTCLFMFLDEAFFGGSKKINGGLKKLISERHVASREKFRENRSVLNQFNIMMASNEEHVVQSQKNGRRHVVLECSNQYAGPPKTPEHFEYFRKILGTETQVLVNYFNSLNMDGWDADNIPATVGTSKQKEHSLTPIQSFVLDVLNDPVIIESALAIPSGEQFTSEPRKDPLQGLYSRTRLYEAFRDRKRGSYVDTQSKFIREFIKITGAAKCGDKKVGTERVVQLPDLSIARAAFKKETSIIHDVFE